MDSTMMFQQEWMNEPHPLDEKEAKLMKLAEQYHQRCERFDRMVCTGRYKGSAMPVDAHERRLITVNAIKVRNELAQIAYSLGFTPREWQSAIHAMLHVLKEKQHG